MVRVCARVCENWSGDDDPEDWTHIDAELYIERGGGKPSAVCSDLARFVRSPSFIRDCLFIEYPVHD